MGFRKLKLFQKLVIGSQTFKWPDVFLVTSSAHANQLIKIANPYSKTVYTHIYIDGKLFNEIQNATAPLTIQEIRKLRHHLTRQIWMWDGVFECIDWQKLNKEPQPKKSKLLPPVMCYNCMEEGNKYTPKQLKIHSIGKCRCCGNDNVKLHETRLAWPVDLRHKGFGFTVITTGRNYTINKDYYKLHHDMSIYTDYNG